MTYQVLARKWRPKGFDEVIGQAHVTTPLRNAIRTDRVPHAILLTGPRGVGKTTLARIVARCLNCDRGPTETPCGECPPCREITAGVSTDVREIDAASRTSVDDVRELIEAIRYAPSPGKHRIFVVDEVHMLSTPAFNALLKTLEEPPARSLFLFATTNPEKIPHTVVSRCQRYDLRRISTLDTVARLGEIAKAEGIELSDRSLRAVAREGDGSLRDALTLVDQLVAHGGSELDDERVAEILDLIPRRLPLAIVAACVAEDAAAALEACGRAGDAGIDPRRLGGALLQLLRDLTVLRVAPESRDLVEGTEEETAELRELAGQTEEARLRRMFRSLIREQEDLAWAPQPMAVLEMAVVRLATMPPGDDVARLIERIDQLERRLEGQAGSLTGTGGGGSGSATTRARREPERRAAAPTGAAPGSPGARVSAPAAARGDAKPDPPEPDAPLDVVFDRLCAAAREANRGLLAALDGGRLVERTADRLRIALPEGFGAQRLRDRVEVLEAVCTRLFGRTIRVEIEAEAAAEETAPERDDERVRRRRQEALDHPAVNDALNILGGEIVEIRPLGGDR